jgi:hypothetical protein
MTKRKTRKPRRSKRTPRQPKTESVFEPIFDSNLETEANSQLCSIFNWYNYSVSDKKSHSYYIDYLKHIGEKTLADSYKKLPDYTITKTTRWLARQFCLGATGLPDNAITKLNESVELIKTELKKKKEKKEEKAAEKKEAKVKTVQERIQEKLNEVYAEIDFMVDLIVDNKYTDSMLYDYLRKNQISHTHISKIDFYIETYLHEFNEVKDGDCDDLKEAYDFLTKRALNKIIKRLKLLQDDCAKWKLTAKKIKAANKKPRKKKQKSSLDQIQKLQFLKETDEFGGLKSVPPTRIVGATQLWVFNVRYRNLGVYICDNNHGFSIKGTTIQNFDLEKSVFKKVRKPDDSIQEVLNAGKVKLKKILPNLTTKEKSLTGRINKDTILLRVIK